MSDAAENDDDDDDDDDENRGSLTRHPENLQRRFSRRQDKAKECNSLEIKNLIQIFGISL